MDKEKKSYYGPFFWLAIASFIVPIVVANATYQNVHPTTKPVPHLDASGVDHALWDYLLKSYVENGLVDYDGMGRDYLFRTYLKQLGQAQAEKLATKAERLALLCNAYNAFVIDGVISHGIRDSVMSFQQDGKEFFDIREHILGNQTLSLNEIEHEMIRKEYKEPRIHVALVCAARSCPALRREAYVGPRISAQLEDQSYEFANNRTYVDFNSTHNQLLLSPILQWYGEDWATIGGYLPWLFERIKDEELRFSITRAINGEVETVFADYNWTLNSQADPSSKSGPSSKKKTNFGSGSIPNG